MHLMRNRFTRCLKSVLWSVGAGCALAAPVVADDTEVFIFTPPGADSRPNILFILDTGESMASPIESTDAYDPEKDYDSTSTGCDPDYVYFQVNTDEQPKSCSGLLAVPRSQLVCNTAIAPLDSVGYANFVRVGYFDAGLKKWNPIPASGVPVGPENVVECYADRGLHGIDALDTDKWATDDTSDGFGNKKGQEIKWDLKGITQVYIFYSANRIAFNAQSTASGSTTRIAAVKRALLEAVKASPGVNVSLMRWDNNAGATSGGMVVHEFAPSETSASTLEYTLYDRMACEQQNPLLCEQIMAALPGSRKPMGETMFEAYSYFAGAPLTYGIGSNVRQQVPFPSVVGSWCDPTKQTCLPTSKPKNGDFYKSPLEGQVCAGKNYIVLLTDGFTEQDRSGDTGNISKLPNFRSTPYLEGGTCDDNVYIDGVPDNGPFARTVGGVTTYPTEDLGLVPGTPPGAAQGSFCVDDIAGYMYNVGVGQNGNKVTTHVVGIDLSSLAYGDVVRNLLKETAWRGGGNYYDATNENDLIFKFTEIFREILLDNASFTSPSVTVNAFNRTQNLNDIFVAVFKPSFGYRWLGNLKKYRLKPGPAENDDIRDLNGDPAVGTDGFFKSDSHSYWPDSSIEPVPGQDGSDASLGGAAGQMTAPGSRTIYTNLSESGTLSVELSELKTDANKALANQLLFGDPDYVPAGCALDHSKLIDWAYGYPITVDDEVDPCSVTVETGRARKDMGDPLHSRPAVITFGGSATAPDVTVFVTTNDGFLHAIDSDTGEELWSFIPRQLLGRLDKLYRNEDAITREYGLDSPIRALRYDKDRDGIIEPADDDRVLLFFGMRRGGSHYFALDVTNRSSPKLLWRIGKNDANISAGTGRHLPGVGQTWSVPALARVNVTRTWSTTEPQSSQKYVLIFGGGYNTSHDAVNLTASGDATGNRIFMVDAFTGELIWRAGPSGDSGADLQSDKMDRAFASDVRVIDLTGDGFADRMYASDLGGRVWRFDIFNGQAPSTLVTGGVFASLGNADNATPGIPANDSRRFFTTPDAALITYQNSTFINIAIGSGNRELPVRDTVINNRFYGLRDYRPFAKLTQAQYDDWEDNYMIRDNGASDPSCGSVVPTDPTLNGLLDVTACAFAAIPPGSPGWKLDMKASGTWDGEKVLADSVTFQGIVYFPSFSPIPPEPDPDDPEDLPLVCKPSAGLNRFYEISAVNAAPRLLWADPTQTDVGTDDRFRTLEQGGIAPSAVFIFPTPEQGERPGPPPQCLVGLAECGEGVANPPVRTFWRQRGSN